MCGLPEVDDELEVDSEPSIHLQEWRNFLISYAQGDWSPDNTPTKPSEPESPSKSEHYRRPSQDHYSSSAEVVDPFNIYSSPIIDKLIAKNVRQYCSKNDYLPPPRSPQEALREKIVTEYDLLGPIQTGNIQSAVDLLSAFFPGCVITFTLFNNHVQTFAAVAGPKKLLEEFQLVGGMWVAPETSLCGHSVLQEEQILFVSDLAEDWRFRSNPYTLAGLKSYIGSAVSLLLDPLNTTPNMNGRPERVGIGSLNILFMSTILQTMSPEQVMVVKNITKILETQIRATWEGHIRTREARVRHAMTDLIEEGFVGVQASMEQHEMSDGVPAIARGTSMSSTSELAQSGLDKTMALSPELDIMCLVDTRSFRVKSKQGLQLEYEHDTSSIYPLSTIAVSPLSEARWKFVEEPSRLLSFLNEKPFSYSFSPSSTLSGIESKLPVDVRSHVIMPFFTLDQPIFVAIALSKSPQISAFCTNIIRSVGSVILAKAIQSRVMEADAAKATFLSSISHELRTPMHSIMSGLSLINSAVQSQDYDSLKSLLDVVDTSGHTLQRILDDVLDFDPVYSSNNKTNRLVTVDLLQLVQNSVQMCLTKSEDLDVTSSIEMNYEQRDWTVYIDDARYHRIFINGLSNALKFCKNGSITISILTSPDSSQLITRIADTGVGIDPKFLPRLLEPFTKQDPHSPGAGLGLSITKNLVNSIGGNFTIQSKPGEGTVFEVILPIRFDGDRSPVNRSAPLVNRQLHEKRLTLQSQSLGLSVNPPAEKSTTPVPRPTPSRRATADPPAARPKHLKQDSLPDEHALRVMVIDDNRICRLLLTRALRKSPVPVKCTEAADGQQAVDAFRKFKPDLVVTDISMPVMDGVTAAQHMRSISEELRLPPCKIYALTGLGSSDPKLKSVGLAGNAALDGWLVKGQDDLKVIQNIVTKLSEDLQRQRDNSAENMLRNLEITKT
ncbi:uncharacterized protein IL334_003773 [Kwoniella shivajii]|uniref:histidine kinase n=1 Tax=Kwoniella shivajii TaxID=564305 RepID=A0ABZ1CYU4_9TREE|nr:hypothetical protein IL334_003773 [Kwoniella shivajii]